LIEKARNSNLTVVDSP